jgi:dihydrolipoamide dehydrogenase
MDYDLIVIGSGPGGYVAAIRASQLGLKTAVIEKESVGGICLNWGCIPTKALLKSAQVFEYINHAADYGINVNGTGEVNFESVIKRSRGVADGMSKGVQFLMKKNKIDVVLGFGKLKSKGVVEVKAADGSTKQITAKNIILATGGRSRELPNLKQDGKKVIGYREAMSLPKQPKSIVVVGSGAIGIEFAYFYNSIGTKVTVDSSGELCKVNVKTASGVEVLEAEVVLSAVGISTNIEGIGLEETGVKTDKGKVLVDDFYRTNVEGIFAIGDIVKGQALAHVASAEGIICVEKIAGHSPEPLNYNNLPGCTYCSPEIASVGYTEKAAKEAGYEIKVGKFPFSASGKASAAGAKDGFVKLIFDAKYGEFLGAHMIGFNVTELIAEVVTARKLEATGHEIIKSVHPHPTMSEAVMEAAAEAYGECIHL